MLWRTTKQLSFLGLIILSLELAIGLFDLAIKHAQSNNAVFESKGESKDICFIEMKVDHACKIYNNVT